MPGRPVRKKPGRKKMGAVRQCQPATSREGTLNDRVSGRRPWNQKPGRKKTTNVTEDRKFVQGGTGYTLTYDIYI